MDNGVVTCVVKKNSTTQVTINHIKNTSPKPIVTETGTVSSSAHFCQTQGSYYTTVIKSSKLHLQFKPSVTSLW